MAFGAAGKYLYGKDTNSGIWAFSIDPNSGALTQIPGLPITTDQNPYDIVTDPACKFLFTSNQGDNTVSVFAIDANSGLLTPVSGSPFGTEHTRGL